MNKRRIKQKSSNDGRCIRITTFGDSAVSSINYITTNTPLKDEKDIDEAMEMFIKISVLHRRTKK